jgi:hypothetical protein
MYRTSGRHRRGLTSTVTADPKPRRARVVATAIVRTPIPLPARPAAAGCGAVSARATPGSMRTTRFRRRRLGSTGAVKAGPARPPWRPVGPSRDSSPTTPCRARARSGPLSPLPGRSKACHEPAAKMTDPAGASLARCDRGQVAQRVIEMAGSERRELNVLAGNWPYPRPVIGERDLGLVWTELGQVVTPDPTAEL